METPHPKPLQFKIEPMTLATVAQVEQLEGKCFSSPWSLDSLVEELTNPLSVFLTAEINSEIVGYIGMHHIIDEGYIANIAVAPDFRGKGAAKAMLDAVMDYAQENDLVLVTLEVRESNANAIALYESFEFETVGRRKNFYTNPTEDALIMTYTL